MFGRIIDYKITKDNYCLLTDKGFRITWEIEEKINPENESDLAYYEHSFLNKKLRNINICTPSWKTYKLSPFNMVVKDIKMEFKWISFMIRGKEEVVFKFWESSNFPKIDMKIKLVS